MAPAWISWVARTEPGRARPRYSRPSSARALLAFTASVWALGFLILVVYDSALLYNLDDLGTPFPGIVFALVMLTAARLAARFLHARELATRSASLGIDTTVSALRWFLALFLVVALPVRYAAAEPAAQAVGTITVVAAAVCGGAGALERARHQPQHAPQPLRRMVTGWALRMTAALTTGIAVASAVLTSAAGAYPETVLLHAATVFLASAVLVTGLVDTAVHKLAAKA